MLRGNGTFHSSQIPVGVLCSDRSAATERSPAALLQRRRGDVHSTARVLSLYKRCNDYFFSAAGGRHCLSLFASVETENKTRAPVF